VNSSTASFEVGHALKCELASEVLRSSGKLRLRVTGWSMLPAVWPGDTLTIERAENGAVSEGDIVLCARDHRFLAHRVVGKNEIASAILTRGDAMLQPDPPVPNDDLLGIVTMIERNGKCIVPRRNLCLSERVIAALLRNSNIAARIAVDIHAMRSKAELRTEDRLEVPGPQIQN
jgi:signal peptidase I